MEIWLDSADASKIAGFAQWLPIKGITTNPTILAREKKPFPQILREVKQAVRDLPIQIQVTAERGEDMLKEAKAVEEYWKGELYIKVPVNPEGLRGISLLKRQGYRITATAVYTREQAFLALCAGADYIAPYYNRMENLSLNAKEIVKDIAWMCRMQQGNAKVLAASFKNSSQVMEALLGGADAVTLPPEVLEQMTSNPMAEAAVDGFFRDWKRVGGENTLDTILTSGR